MKEHDLTAHAPSLGKTALAATRLEATSSKNAIKPKPIVIWNENIESDFPCLRADHFFKVFNVKYMHVEYACIST